MVNYRRNKPDDPEALYFLTFNTRRRINRFVTSEDYVLLLQTLRHCAARYDVRFVAWVFLPDHIHVLLKPSSADYSQVVRHFKRLVSAGFQDQGRLEAGDSLWQDRFWEHTVRDEADYNRCVEYIHWNPVKHGITRWPEDWTHSSYHQFVVEGIYPASWRPISEPEVSGAEWD